VEFAERGPHAITERGGYRRHLDRVRERGYAMSVEETACHLTAVAVAGLGPSGRVAAAPGVAMATARCPLGRRQELLEWLRSFGDRIAGAWGMAGG
jgi:DNA-binding IclR family transcriptional regulator